MVASLEEMVRKGQTKLTAKSSTMATNWSNAKSRCIDNYGKMPFNANVKAAHAAMVNAATYRSPDPAKWATNWKAKMS